MKSTLSLAALMLGAAVLVTPALAQGAADNAGGSQAAASASADTTGNASALSSVPDTQKKYKRASRASDFQKEAETTRQLNQQVASANGLPKQ